jgi:DNA-binding LytR/AlgR family response regulator
LAQLVDLCIPTFYGTLNTTFEKKRTSFPAGLQGLAQGIVHATTAKDSFWVNYRLAELEAALPPEEFFRARREVLVNMLRITEIKPYFKSSFLLVMSDAASTEIALSERQARPLRQRLPGL